jgi:hydroxymethylbilane synthase
VDRLRLATRGSTLALVQAEVVAKALAGASAGAIDVEVVPIRTTGDERADPAAAEDKSRFVKEIELALLAGEVDLAVHSAKDVPGELPDGLRIVAVPERADPRDALCGAGSLGDLGEGARVGTASLRRRSQLLAARADLDVADLHGNVDTRLRRLAAGDFDALVLAAAGLARLGRAGEGRPIPTSEMTPAPGQGCLALEARTDDERIAELVDPLSDRHALVELTAERALVSALDATCRTPIGAHASLVEDGLELAAFVGLPDGSTWIRDELRGDAENPAALGRDVGARLLAAGAAEVLAASERALGSS